MTWNSQEKLYRKRGIESFEGKFTNVPIAPALEPAPPTGTEDCRLNDSERDPPPIDLGRRLL